MCRQGFCSLIGISSRRVSRCAKSYRGLDIRTLAVSRGETKAPSVRSFFSNMYFSAGELVPHEWSEQQDFSFEKAVASLWEPPSAKLGLLQPAELVRRFLPPGRLSDLFRLYHGFCLAKGLAPAAAETFRHIWRGEHWDKCLRFRKQSTHTVCSTCDSLRTKILRAFGP